MIVYCASLCCFDRSDLTEAGPMFLEDTYILLLDACILLKVFCCHCLKKTTKLLKGDAMNLTLIYNNATSFPSWIQLMLSWFYFQDRYLNCSRTILESSFNP